MTTKSEIKPAPRVRHVPNRTCVVCRQTSEKKSLLRVVRRPERDGGGVQADPSGRANGRGAYVCAAPACIERALKQKRFERSLGVKGVPDTLADELKDLCPAPDAGTTSSSGATAL